MTEPMYLISKKEFTEAFIKDSFSKDLYDTIRARGPVQQAPAPQHRTYESCHKHFSCPDGEECWYWSQDYYWDCGNGAAKVFEASQKASAQEREKVLDELATMYANVPEQFLDGTYRLHSEWRDKIDSLRQPGQKQDMSSKSTDPENVSKNSDEIDTSKQDVKD